MCKLGQTMLQRRREASIYFQIMFLGFIFVPNTSSGSTILCFRCEKSYEYDEAGLSLENDK